jgi:hypothetical protein
MFEYEIFKVPESSYHNVDVGSNFGGGVCIDGIFDDERDQFLLIVRYESEKQNDNTNI